jgi:hypothetical protein
VSVLLLFLWQMVEKLSVHCSGIPVEFDGVLEPCWLVMSLRQRIRCSSSVVELGICHIVHSLDSYMPIFLKRAARQSCPVLSIKFATASFQGLPVYSVQILWVSLPFLCRVQLAECRYNNSNCGMIPSSHTIPNSFFTNNCTSQNSMV